MRGEKYDYTLEEFYFLLMPVLRQLIASAWDVRRGQEIILRSGRDVQVWSGWRMARMVQLPVNGSWIMWEHSRDGWADFPVVISMYELIDSLAGATHRQSTRGPGLGPELHSAHIHSCSKQHGKYFLPSFVKMFQPSNKFPLDLEPVWWHDAPKYIYRVSAKISENDKRFAGSAKVFL